MYRADSDWLVVSSSVKFGKQAPHISGVVRTQHGVRSDGRQQYDKMQSLQLEKIPIEVTL